MGVTGGKKTDLRTRWLAGQKGGSQRPEPLPSTCRRAAFGNESGCGSGCQEYGRTAAPSSSVVQDARSTTNTWTTAEIRLAQAAAILHGTCLLLASLMLLAAAG
jgi:hypothetical protein